MIQNEPAINTKMIPKNPTLAWTCVLRTKSVSEVIFPENLTTKLESDQGEPKEIKFGYCPKVSFIQA